MSKFRHHVFICQNTRPSGSRPACASGGGFDVMRALQERLLGGLHPGLCETVAVTGCACLGLCFAGPVMVVYPDAVWYHGLLPADIDEIVTSHLLHGKPVERLRYRWPDKEE